MIIDNTDKQYAISSRIKYLEGKKQLILDGEIEESLSDIEAKIQALTNLLELL